MNSVRNYRRYLRLKIQFHTELEDFELASAFQAKFDDTTGTAFPAWVPWQSLLTAAGYTTLDDITGADSDELQRWAGLTHRQANAVLTASGERRADGSSAPTITANATGQAA